MIRKVLVQSFLMQTIFQVGKCSWSERNIPAAFLRDKWCGKITWCELKFDWSAMDVFHILASLCYSPFSSSHVYWAFNMERHAPPQIHNAYHSFFRTECMFKYWVCGPGTKSESIHEMWIMSQLQIIFT